MQGTLATPIDMMAALVDKTTRKSEVLDVDQAYLVRHEINYILKHAQFAVAFGGRDSKGKLHPDPARKEKIAQITIPDPDFTRLFTDHIGNPLRGAELGVAIETAFTEVVLPSCYSLSTDWAFDEIEILLDGETVFKKEKGKPAVNHTQLKLLKANKGGQ